jgi:methyl-accepting chemotaxis protein
MSSQLAVTAGEISQSNEALAQGASEQAASIEETSAATSELDGATRDNVTRASAAAEAISAEAQVALQADQKLNEALESMKEMVSASERISRIIRTIDEIAFQTNILALNAAVEAARAGDAGLGFNIVAEEVRNLAQRSATAAKETEELVSGSVASSGAASARLEEATKIVRAMTGHITDVKRQIDEVHQIGQQQARGLDQITATMSQMEKVTSATAAQAQERAAASVELTSQSTALRDVVAGLRRMF